MPVEYGNRMDAIGAPGWTRTTDVSLLGIYSPLPSPLGIPTHIKSQLLFHRMFTTRGSINTETVYLSAGISTLFAVFSENVFYKVTLTGPVRGLSLSGDYVLPLMSLQITIIL